MSISNSAIKPSTLFISRLNGGSLTGRIMTNDGNLMNIESFKVCFGFTNSLSNISTIVPSFNISPGDFHYLLQNSSAH